MLSFSVPSHTLVDVLMVAGYLTDCAFRAATLARCLICSAVIRPDGDAQTEPTRQDLNGRNDNQAVVLPKVSSTAN